MKAYWLITKKATVWCQVNKDGNIVFCAPLISKFKGQHLSACTQWLAKIFGENEGLAWEHSKRILK